MPSAEPHSPSPYPLSFDPEALDGPQGERGRKSMFLTKYLPSPFSGRAPEKISPWPLGPGLTLRHIAAGSGEGWDPRDASVDPLAARGRGRRGADSRSRSPADARGGGVHQPVGAGPWVRTVQPRAGPATGTVPIQLSFKAPLGAVARAGALGASSSGRIPAACRTTRSNPCTGGSGLFQPRLNIRAAARQSNGGPRRDRWRSRRRL